jgi:hypothetical protein
MNDPVFGLQHEGIQRVFYNIPTIEIEDFTNTSSWYCTTFKEKYFTSNSTIENSVL